jgi:hypothetical protein
MASLLEGIDASAFDAPPSSQGSMSVPSPVKAKAGSRRSPVKPSRRGSQCASFASPGPGPGPFKRTPGARPKSAAIGCATARPKVSPRTPSSSSCTTASVKPPPPSFAAPPRLSQRTAPPSTASQPNGKRNADHLLDFLGLAPAKRVAADSQRPVPPPTASARESQRDKESARATGTFNAFNKRTATPGTQVKVQVQLPQAPPPPSSDFDYDEFDGGWDLDALADMDETALLGGIEVSMSTGWTGVWGRCC